MSENAIICTRVCLLPIQHFGLEVLLAQWSTQAHTFVAARGEHMPTSDDVLLLTSAIGMCIELGLEWEDQVKAKYLIATITVVR